MNIPQPSPSGWTPDYLAQLNQVVDDIIKRPDTTLLHGMSEREYVTTWQAALNDYRIFKYYDGLFTYTAPNASAWIAKRVAARCWMKARLAVMLALLIDKADQTMQDIKDTAWGESFNY